MKNVNNFIPCKPEFKASPPLAKIAEQKDRVRRIREALRHFPLTCQGQFVTWQIVTLRQDVGSVLSQRAI